ncbi:hypothetical protein NP493_126g08040 [Ridgeia piscesae]|uniref:Uncharacterized protein n=1 Tax=Ridgeia piscesae TaxID=27915 RepID=A0AAD9P5Z6_RIDPI|nr:hypothetical protein NP493_126g08040 [Ridgeia piscesae]
MDTTDSRRRSTVVSGDVLVLTEACVTWHVGSSEEKNVYVHGAAVTWPGVRRGSRSHVTSVVGQLHTRLCESKMLWLGSLPGVVVAAVCAATLQSAVTCVA